MTLLNGEEPSYTETTTTYKDSLPSDLICRAIAISKYIAKSHPRPIYLVLHNIDGLKLRSQVAQNCLAALVANSAIRSTTTVGTDSNQTRNSNAQVIRLITSVDRVDAVEILWDVTCTANFSWVSYCNKMTISAGFTSTRIFWQSTTLYARPTPFSSFFLITDMEAS